MSPTADLSGFSPQRAHLASFENAYAVALRIRSATGVPQFVLRTGSPLQPFRVSSRDTPAAGQVLAMVA